MEIVETIHCRGHKNVTAMHKSTFEITKDPDLSKTGDCIIGVSADKGAADLSSEFRSQLSKDGAVLITTLSIGDEFVVIRSEGSKELTLTHPTDLVWRRSSFTCSRTVSLYSDFVAKTLPRSLIEKLQRGDEMIVTLTVQVPESR